MGFVELILREKEYTVKIYPFHQYGEPNIPETSCFIFRFPDAYSMFFDVLRPNIRDAIYLAMSDLQGRENIPAIRFISS